MKEKIYFPNLDGLRAIAALMVVVSHIELYKPEYNFPRLITSNSRFALGSIGVTFFFVLSGFLITYLLLIEKKQYNKIHIKNFYLRRILRIWPLFFTVLLTGYFIYPTHSIGKGFLMNCIFLTNITFIWHLLPSVIDPIWSIGVEEQFYLFQPHILRIKSFKKILNLLIILLIIWYAARIYFTKINVHTSVMTSVIAWFYFTRFDCMMIGAIGAIWTFNRNHKKTFTPLIKQHYFTTNIMQSIFYIIFLFMICLTFVFNKPVNNQLYAIIFLFILINLATNPKSLISLEYKPLKYIGRISYGVYLLHKFPLILVLYLCSRWLPGKPIIANCIIYIMVPILSILLASFSFYYFEKYFLTLKDKFAFIHKAGNSIKTNPSLDLKLETQNTKPETF